MTDSIAKEIAYCIVALGFLFISGFFGINLDVIIIYLLIKMEMNKY